MMLNRDNNFEIVAVDCKEDIVAMHVDAIVKIFDDCAIVPCRRDRDNSDRYSSMAWKWVQ